MSDLFDRLDAPTAKVEGGYINHSSDRGGETNHGITRENARRGGFTGDMRDMTAAQAKQIRKALYYIQPGVHLLAPLSEAIAREVYDAGILHGPGVPAKWLQRLLNALNRQGRDYRDIDVDGAVGGQSRDALAAFLKRNGKLGETRLLKLLNCLQGAFLVQITEGRELNEDFLNGWADNRVELPS